MIQDSLDLVFIDGNHDYESVKEDIQLQIPKLKSGGLLAGHDYHLEEDCSPGVKRAVDELLKDKISLKNDSVWLHIKE